MASVCSDGFLKRLNPSSAVSQIGLDSIEQPILPLSLDRVGSLFDHLLSLPMVLFEALQGSRLFWEGLTCCLKFFIAQHVVFDCGS